jgi:hypothetical protein
VAITFSEWQTLPRIDFQQIARLSVDAALINDPILPERK